MKLEKIEPSQEKKEQFEEIQRLELDPDEGVDIVIRKVQGKCLEYKEEIKKKANLKGEIVTLVRTMPMKYFPAQISLEKNGEIIENFQKLSVLSPRFYFREGDPEGIKDAWACFKRGLITMPHQWKSNKDVLALAHEIGHDAYAFDHHEEIEKQDKLDKEEAEAMLSLHSIKKRGAFWYREKPKEAPSLKPATEKDIKRFNNRLKKIREQIRFLRAREERGSWARGLYLIRKIKREKGIDLIKPFRGKTSKETRENLDKYIHGNALGSYEYVSREKIKKLGLSEELKGIFTKKYKEEAGKASKEVSEEASKI